MIYIEMPLWVAICLTVVFILCFVHQLFGNLLAKIIFKFIEKKYKDEKENKNEKNKGIY